MSDWREHAAKEEWLKIFHPDLSDRDCSDLLAMLRKAVPMIKVQNSKEWTTRHKLPNEVEGADLKHAAQTLDEGELESMVDGDPPSPLEEWTDAEAQARRYLQKALDEPEPTTGDEELSRKTHARKALEALNEIASKMKTTVKQAANPEEAASIEEAMALVAHFALSAGLHAQTAAGKNFVFFALAREKQLVGQSAARDEINADRRSAAQKWKANAEEIARQHWRNKPGASALEIAGRVLTEFVARAEKIKAGIKARNAESDDMSDEDIAFSVREALQDQGLANADGVLPSISTIRKAIGKIKSGVS